MNAIITYVCYAVISIALTVWVGWTLHRNGRLFVIEAFHGNEAMADAVNHLLLVGFYLINFGFVCLFLKYGTKPTDATQAIEYVATKLGIVLVVLGVMHFFNMFNLAKMRAKGRRGAAQAQALAAAERDPDFTPGR